MKIQRLMLNQLQNLLIPGKVVVIYGPRQAGKTTLVKDFIAQQSKRLSFINADELRYREALASQDRQRLVELVGSADGLVIDEAQRVPEIGLNLKILVDALPEKTFIATGSASFDLANQMREPLTGRSITLTLYPVSYQEIAATFGGFEARAQLERWLIWGGYPEIVACESTAQREMLLGELVGSYLFRDLLQLEGIRHADKIVDLLRLLAFQIGHEVSLAELASSLALHRSTVERYLDLLEKVFVIFKVSGFSRNLRKEISKSARFYFYDNGVRNAMIQNFNAPGLRSDIGQLWENFLAIERRKFCAYAGKRYNVYFWRTHDQKELDYIEEGAGQITAYEFKWQGEIKTSTRQTFLSAYPGATIHRISRENFETFIAG